MATVEFGYSLPTFGDEADPAFLKDLAVRLEDEGFDSLWIRDHLQLPVDTPFFDPLVTHAALSSVTEDVKLGTATLIPVRHPVVFSKLVMTLAEFADDRLIVGLGYGGLESDFAPIDIPFDERQQAYTETVDIFKGVSETGSFDYDGELFSVNDVTLAPRAGSEPDVWLGGNSRHILDRAGREADGWIPYALPPDKLDRGIDILRDEYDSDVPVAVVVPLSVREDGVVPDETLSSIRDRFEDDPENRGVLGTPDECVGQIDRYIETGVDQIVFDSRYDADHLETHVDLLTEEVLPRL